jgi:hypothetical protein
LFGLFKNSPPLHPYHNPKSAGFKTSATESWSKFATGKGFTKPACAALPKSHQAKGHD